MHEKLEKALFCFESENCLQKKLCQCSACKYKIYGEHEEILVQYFWPSADLLCENSFSI